MRAALLRLLDAVLAILAIATPLSGVATLVTLGGWDAFARGLVVVAAMLAGPALLYVVRGGR